jgi:hypothetical protein
MTMNLGSSRHAMSTTHRKNRLVDWDLMPLLLTDITEQTMMRAYTDTPTIPVALYSAGRGWY